MKIEYLGIVEEVGDQVIQAQLSYNDTYIQTNLPKRIFKDCIGLGRKLLPGTRFTLVTEFRDNQEYFQGINLCDLKQPSPEELEQGFRELEQFLRDRDN